MQHREGTFMGEGGSQLFYRSWHPPGSPKAVMVLVHSIGEHSGRYTAFARQMVARNLAVYAFDLRGHGRSQGVRGHADSFEEFRLDLHIFLQLVAEREADRALYMYGHGLGGLIALEYAQHYPAALEGVIASSPYLNGPPLPSLLGRATRLMSRLRPAFTLENSISPTALSRDTAVVKAYKNDPLVHNRISARLGTEVATAIIRTMEDAAHFNLPLLIIQGDADKIATPESSQEFFEKVASTDKARIVYEGGYHESHNDIHRERVLCEIGQWLEYQIDLVVKREENTEEGSSIKGSDG